MKEQKNKIEMIDAIRGFCNQLQDVLEEESASSPLARASRQNEELLLKEAAKEVLIKLSCDIYWEYDSKDNRLMFSQPFQSTEVNSDQMEMDFEDFLKMIPETYQKIITRSFQNLLQGISKIEEFEYQLIHKDGTRDWYHTRSSVVLNRQGEVVKIIGINNNITTSKAEREKIVQEQAKNEMLISFANNYIWEFDCEERCFTANNSLLDKLGHEHRKYSYDEIAKLHHKDTPLKLDDEIGKLSTSGHTRMQMYSQRDRGYLIFDVNYGGLCDSEGHVYRFIGTLDDITEKELLMATAARDPLTNAYNRRMGDLRLKSSFTKYREQGEFFTIAFFDIDKFKYVNDKYGHDMGDYVLKAVCDTISKEIRSSDMLFRWGGDELLLICSGISKENIYANIDRIRLLIENAKFEFNNEKLHLTVSIGAAYFYKNDVDEQQAVKRADRSLYKAKLAGRNKVCILL